MCLYSYCSGLQDYEEQSNTIIIRFKAKGYKEKELLALKEKVKKMYRNMIMKRKSEDKKNKKKTH